MAVSGKKMSVMVPIYGSLIIKGEKSISNVPEGIRGDVRKWLIDNADNGGGKGA